MSKSLKTEEERYKNAGRYEAVKAKTITFPSDVLQIKSGTPHLKSADISTPPFFALRFLTTANSHATSDSRAKANKNKDVDETQLLPVELTINKKIKFPHHKKMSKSSVLGASDGDVIEHLRHQLRPQRLNETMSVLEAMGDPEMRKERFYYEPLSSFMKEKRNNTARNKSFQDPCSLRVVNIMIPGVNEIGDDGIMLPFNLSRNLNNNTRSTARKSNSQSEVYSFLPRVVGNSLIRRLNEDKNRQLIEYYLAESMQHSQNSTNFILPNSSKESANGMYFPKKSQVNLPHIGHRYYTGQQTENREAIGTVKSLPTVNNIQRNAATTQLPVHNEGIIPRTSTGFPRRATTTATGKSHLIGPMNKVNIIADYNKAMQGGFITYDEYIKKISALSLHKVAMANNSQRHFQVVRDETNHMKPRLTHVDLNKSPAKTNENRNIGNKLKESHSTPPNKPPRLHKIVIGQDLDLEEHNQQTTSNFSDEFDTPRYKKSQNYHWNHDTREYTPHWREAYEKEKWFQKSRSGYQSPEKPKKSEVQNSTDSNAKATTDIAFRPIDEYMRMKEATSINYSRRKARKFLKSDIPVINENEVSTLPYEQYTVSKIPYQLEEPSVVMSSISRAMPKVVINDEEINEEWNAESVFQPHLENMLRTIKKVGADKKKSKPEAYDVKPVTPTVVITRNISPDKLLTLHKKSSGHLNLEKTLRVNTPPPPSPSTSEN